MKRRGGVSAVTCQRSPSSWSVSSLSQTCVPSKDGISQPMGEPSWLICLTVAEFFGLTFRLWAAMITEGVFSCQPVISCDKPFWHRDLWTRILAPSQTSPKPDYPFLQQRHVGSGNYWLAVVMVQAASLQITDGSSPYSHFGSISKMTDGTSWYVFFFKADVECGGLV